MVGGGRNGRFFQGMPERENWQNRWAEFFIIVCLELAFHAPYGLVAPGISAKNVSGTTRQTLDPPDVSTVRNTSHNYAKVKIHACMPVTTPVNAQDAGREHSWENSTVG